MHIIPRNNNEESISATPVIIKSKCSSLIYQLDALTVLSYSSYRDLFSPGFVCLC